MYDDKEETTEKQKERIQKVWADGHRHPTEGGRVLKITKRFGAQSQGADGGGKSERTRRRNHYGNDQGAPSREYLRNCDECFEARFMGRAEGPSSWKIVKLVFLREPDAEPKKGIRCCRAITPASLMSKWCDLYNLTTEKEKEHEG